MVADQGHWMRYVTRGTLGIATGLVILLGFRVSNLEDRLEDARRRISHPYPGHYLPAFETVDITGQPVRLGESADSGRQILLYFTTSCQYCLASLPAWKELSVAADTFRSYPLRVHAISLDAEAETRTYADEHDLTFSILRFPSPKLANLYRASSVPQLLIVDHDGMVLYARRGVLHQGPALDSILRLMNTRGATATQLSTIQ